MNHVNLIGSLVVEPELRRGREGHEECLLRIAVPRHSLHGEREPGLIYVDVTTFGKQARVCAEELAVGHRVAIAGTLERDDDLSGHGPRRSRWEVHAHQIYVVGGPGEEVP